MGSSDVTTDYDIFVPAFVADPYGVYDEVRAQCPVAHTDRNGGSWLPVTYDALHELAHDVEGFNSSDILVFPRNAIPASEAYADVTAPPITSDPPEHQWARRLILPFFAEQIADRRANPRDDDLVTQLIQADVEGEPVPDSHIIGTCNLMLVAGIDTTSSSIGSSLWHLAQHPEHRRQLREQPDLWPTAVEELLRAYAPVTMARIVTEDVEFMGCPMKAGDRVLMAFLAANRDPAVFDDPEAVRLDREGNRHMAFGSGIHRCAGSNLPRLELRVALQVFLERIPEFTLVDADAVTWAGGQIHGPRVCEVSFDPAAAVPAG